VTYSFVKAPYTAIPAKGKTDLLFKGAAAPAWFKCDSATKTCSAADPKTAASLVYGSDAACKAKCAGAGEGGLRWAVGLMK
jgi:hypothetical protein